MIGAEMRALLVTDLAVAELGEMLDRARAIVAELGERVAFGVRDHAAPIRARRELACALVALGARVIVHDRCDLALVTGAHGVQLGERSISVRDARALLGPGAWIGRSCHDEAGLLEARGEGADAATLSPLFASPGKGAPLGEVRFAELRARVPDLPVIALGGVDETNAGRAWARGASGVAAIRAWLSGGDPVSAVRMLVCG